MGDTNTNDPTHDAQLLELLERDFELRNRVKELSNEPVVLELKGMKGELRDIQKELIDLLPTDGIHYRGKRYVVDVKETSPLKRKMLQEHGIDLTSYDQANAELKKRLKRTK